ncbi:DUF305 domain-containing protein [Patescibacteria group bacterium]|nr:MAG: DUF305 domain-containing protein [Patescibacteria group bacterium]
MKKEITYGVVGLFIGIIIGLIVSPMTLGTRPMSFAGSMNSTVDKHFIEQMIPHHEGAIAMAELALQRSKRPEILSLATNIIEAQQKEIVQMNQWYSNWFSSSIPVHSMGGMVMSGMSMGSEKELEILRNSKDFDLEFIRQMIPHHEMAVVMAEMLETSSNRKEMLNLAKQITISQSQEIETMRGWYTSWSVIK